jgi:two-component system, OmpR family, response regulator
VNILVVDDSEALRILVKKVLQKDGRVVLEAEDVEQGLSALEDSLVDLVLLDLEMPEADGFEFLTRRSRLDVPVIMMSGRSDEESLRKAMELGALGFITKPFRPSQLLERIQELVPGFLLPKP